MDKKEVLERLHSHPLYKRASRGLSEGELKHIDSVVEEFVGNFVGSLAAVSGRPSAVTALKGIASGKLSVSGSAG